MGHRSRLFLLLALLLAACAGDARSTPPPAPGVSIPVAPLVLPSSPAIATQPSAVAAVTSETPQPTTPAATSQGCATVTPLKLQLDWVNQGQFAGYYAAVAKGFYAAQCLDVMLLEGGLAIDTQLAVMSGQAQFGVAWVPAVLVAREQGQPLVNLAQVFQRIGTIEVSWASLPVPTILDMTGKRIGTWGGSDVHVLFAALRNEGIDPRNPDEVKIIEQGEDMEALLNRNVDAAQASIYDEYAQVLETINPDTGQLYQPNELVILDYNDFGTAMLEDHLFASDDWLAAEGNAALAVRFLAASFQGWQFCRDYFDECVQIIQANAPSLGESHIRWQLNEINQLVWPSPVGIGFMDKALWNQTVTVALTGGVITAPPSEGAYRTDLTQAALSLLEGDITGETYRPIEVVLKAGGE